MKKYYKKYILQLLEWQETKLKCINIGWKTSEEIKTEIKLIEECKKYFKEITKEK